MNFLYNDLYRAILSFCDKNAKFNLKLVNQKFNSLLKDKIYESKTDFYINLILELDDENIDENYVPILYRIKMIDEHFIIACGILLNNKQCYELIKQQTIVNLRFDRVSDTPYDLFEMKFRTSHGIIFIKFSVNKILEIINGFDKQINDAVFGMQKLLNSCDTCDKQMGFGRGKVHTCNRIRAPYSYLNQLNRHTGHPRHPSHPKENFFWNPYRYIHLEKEDNYFSIKDYINIYNSIYSFFEYAESDSE